MRVIGATILTALVLALILLDMAEGTGTYPPCTTENGGPIPCVWNAEDQGNGEGNSLLYKGDGIVVVITHEKAREITQ